MNRRDLENAICKEVERWPGVTVEFAEGGKHPKAKFWFNGQMLARPYSGSPSDGAYAVHQCLGDMRRVMKQLGAARDKPEPSKDEDEGPYRKPNTGAAERADPVSAEKAKPRPDIIDQLVEARVASADDAAIARAEKLIGGSPAVNAQLPAPVLTSPVDVSDEPAERLVKQLRDRGFDLTVAGSVSRASVIVAASAMIVDGIYFGLPEDVYHNVPRLGASSLIKLNQSAGDFWAGSWLDPDRKEEADETVKAWKVVGRAYHCARLEPDQFELRYCRKPGKADYAEQVATHGACWNGTEIGNKLGELRATKKSAGESVAEQAQRLEDAGFGGVIWPLIEARANAERGDRIALDAKIWDEIVRDMERLRGRKEIAELLSDGASEVSIFWTDENNIERKARFDWLAATHWSDLKTFDNSRGKKLEQALADAVRFNRYYVTAASYFEAAEAIRTGLVQIVGEADDFERGLVARLQIRPEHLDCWFLFQQKSGVPNLVARRFGFFGVPAAIENSWDTGASEEAIAAGHEATRRPTQLYAKAKAEIDYAKRLFAMYSQVYAPGEPWAPIDPMGEISDSDFAPNWLEGLYE